MMTNLVSDAIMEWLKGTRQADLQRWAEQEEDMTDKLLKQYRLWIPLAGYFLRDVRPTLESLTRADYDAILRRALQDAPERGVICYLHKPWFYAQCETLKQAILARWPGEVTHGDEHNHNGDGAGDSDTNDSEASQ